MKKIHFIISLFVLAISWGCSTDNVDVNINDVSNPANISALMTISQDNTGVVTIIPTGEGVTQFQIYFGDSTAEPVVVNPGGSVTHPYTEGVYQVKIVGMTINGNTTDATKELTVSFLPPTDLIVDIQPVAGDNMSITVGATANLATYFQVYFGDVPDEIPVNFNPGDVVTHTYSNVGTYDVKVVALNGGSATAESIQTVIISNPVLLPIDFQSTTINYAFGNFGGAVSTVIDNPDISAGNGSTKVAQLFKSAGSEIWAGSVLSLGTPIDFTSMQTMKMKVWSPQAGIIVKMKIENLTDGSISMEVDATTTVANGWEELSYNFAAANNANSYQKVVVFFDFGVNGTGANYYYDDIKLTSGVETLSLPLTFQSSTLAYNFGNFGGANTSVIDNPDMSGINTSTKVATLVKGTGAQVWAGSSILLGSPMNFAVQQKIKMKVWSPQAGITVKMKLEKIDAGNPDPTNIEVDAISTVANGWEELTFDFTGINNANNYQRIVVFFGFGQTTAGTYYFDDIKQSN
jgi:hypothetical protein